MALKRIEKIFRAPENSRFFAKVFRIAVLATVAAGAFAMLDHGGRSPRTADPGKEWVQRAGAALAAPACGASAASVTCSGGAASVTLDWTTDGAAPDGTACSNASVLLNQIQDASSYRHAVTAFGTAEVSAAQSKFGGASMYFPDPAGSGGGENYFEVPPASDWNLGSGDFTIDFWVRFDSVTYGNPVYAIPGWYLTHSADSIWQFQNYPSGSTNYPTISRSAVISSGTWYHVAFVRHGDTWYIFQNGVMLGAPEVRSAGEVISIPANPLKIGFGSPNMRIDELRISNAARWTANFAPPAAPYAADAATTLLVHADQPSQSVSGLPCSGSWTGGGLSSNANYAYTVRFNNGGHLISQGTFATPVCVPVADIKANGSDGPLTVSGGTQAAIAWSSTGADSCTVSNTASADTWTGTSGTQNEYITSSRTYNLSCANAAGSAADAVTVNASLGATCAPSPASANVGQQIVWIASGIAGNPQAAALQGAPALPQALTIATWGSDGTDFYVGGFGTAGSQWYLYKRTAAGWTEVGGAPPGIPSSSTYFVRGNLYDSGALYLGSGSRRAFRKFTVANNSWTTISFPGAATNMSAAFLNNVLYAFTDSVERVYRLDSTRWTLLSARVPTARAGKGTAVSANGKIYLMGGDASSAGFGANEMFDPATGWTSRAALPEGVSQGSGVYQDGKIYLFGASSGNVLVYDIWRNTWRSQNISATGWPVARMASGFFSGAIHIAGGFSSAWNANSWLYNRGGYYFTWLGDDGLSGRGDTIGITYIASGLKSARVTVQDSPDGSSAGPIACATSANISGGLPLPNAGPGHTFVYGLGSHAHSGASASDPDNNLASYSWRFVSYPGVVAPALTGASGTFSSGAGGSIAGPTYTPNALGDYLLQLTATDASGASANASITETAVNNAPVISAMGGPHGDLTVGSSHTHDGASVSDPDSNLSTYVWSWASDGCPSACPALTGASGALPLSGGAVPGPTFTPAAAGTYTLRLTVTDRAGAQASGTVSDTASAPLGPSLAECEDGLDNDGDGRIDYVTSPRRGPVAPDRGCTSLSDNNETDSGIPSWREVLPQ